jgi:Flp pilus assembly protein TadG
MPANTMRSILDRCGRQFRSLRLRSIGRRGGVAISFAVAMVPIAMATAAAVDFSRIAAGRAALQRAADNAALSGAAAYVAYAAGDAFNAVAVTVATSAFCNASTALPGGFTVDVSPGSKRCGTGQGPAVAAAIGGYKAGTLGIVARSGCSVTRTVVSGYKCGFVVTVTAKATTNVMFAGLLGASTTLSVTATAANPFINLASALSTSLNASAWNANSVWVYPLRLDANGQPDFVTNSGALPDASACTGNPTQTSCGSYTMIASSKYGLCKTDDRAAACTVNGTIFGDGGVIQNVSISGIVITATTPLGIAFQSVTGGSTTYGYNKSNTPQTQPTNGCTWPATAAYNTVSQVYDASNKPLIVDSYGNWVYPTHWFYSSYLANNKPPSQDLLAMQRNTFINPATTLAYQIQVITSVPQIVAGANSPTNCIDAAKGVNAELLVTTYPATGNSNCSLYIAKDPAAVAVDPAYAGKCFDPTDTPGQRYAAMSCQSYGKGKYAFFWNDMSGGGDDKDYNDGMVVVTCDAVANVVLIK